MTDPPSEELPTFPLDHFNLAHPSIIAVISSVEYDEAIGRVAITVEPCARAAYFSVFRRFAGEAHLLRCGLPVPGLSLVQATGDRQTFFDYTCPLGGENLEYLVMSYLEYGETIVAGLFYSEPVAINITTTRDTYQGWTGWFSDD